MLMLFDKDSWVKCGKVIQWLIYFLHFFMGLRICLDVILVLSLKLFCTLFMVVGEEDEGLHEGNEP